MAQSLHGGGVLMDPAWLIYFYAAAAMQGCPLYAFYNAYHVLTKLFTVLFYYISQQAML